MTPVRPDVPNAITGEADGRIDGLAALLARAGAELGEIWLDRPPYAAQIEELRTRLVERRINIAALGQFKRGKSTFLNALLGCAVLPTGILPLTAVPTFIRWAASAAIAVTYLDGRTERPPVADPAAITRELTRLVTEEGNPHNRKRVARVDVEFPAPILRDGIILIDTPGIGSTLRHNTDAALGVLPACDAGYFVLSADPPVTAAELDYLDQVRPGVARLFFILNKIDYLTTPDRTAATEFLRRTLAERMPAETEIAILGLSARRGLEAKIAGDRDGLVESGLAEVERRLTGFLAREKDEALRCAVAGKAAGVLAAARMDLALGVRALEMPVADLEGRAARFTGALERIGRQRLTARDLLAGDRRRLFDDLEERVAALRAEARLVLVAQLDRTVAAEGKRGDSESTAKRAISVAIPEFFAPKLADISREFAAGVDAVLARHVDQAGRLVASVREEAATLFEILSLSAGEVEAFVMAREPFWVTQKWEETIGSLAGTALEGLLPAGFRAVRVRSRLVAEIDGLVQRNVENLRWATRQSLEDALRRFAAWFDDRLADAIGATQGAIDAALVKRREHTEQVGAELARLRQAADRVAAAQRDLAALQRIPGDRIPLLSPR